MICSSCGSSLDDCNESQSVFSFCGGSDSPFEDEAQLNDLDITDGTGEPAISAIDEEGYKALSDGLARFDTFQ